MVESCASWLHGASSTAPGRPPALAPSPESIPHMSALKPLKQREIFGYAIGDLGMNLNFQMMGFYLAFFYTDVFGISTGHVAGLFLAARVWDAVNDPLMGYIADRTQTRWGRVALKGRS